VSSTGTPQAAVAEGGCLCGAVRFSAELPALWVAHCHCSRCQRAHGAPFVTWVGFRADAVVLPPEGSSLRWFTTPEGAGRGFCAHCGSPMCFKSPAYPGELHIARAVFLTELQQLPSSNVFFSTHARWAVDVHQLPREDELQPGPDGAGLS
jgi:hypothetical protein